MIFGASLSDWWLVLGLLTALLCAMLYSTGREYFPERVGSRFWLVFFVAFIVWPVALIVTIGMILIGAFVWAFAKKPSE